MLLVGLTGGIASGKSVIGTFFERRGAHLRRADQEAHLLMAPGGPVWTEIRARFGAGVLGADGTVDRKALGRLVFNDPSARRDLEAIVQPRVIAAMKAEAARLRDEGRVDVYVSEAALIFEAGQTDFYDRIVVAYCRPAVQIERLMARDGLDREEAGKRLAAQMDPEGKKTRADYVIDTSEALEDTLARAEAVWARLKEEAGRKGRRRT
jgi:dephospho-CoA kinase